MSRTLIIILLVLLVFGGGFGGYHYIGGYGAGIGVIPLVIILFLLFA